MSIRLWATPTRSLLVFAWACLGGACSAGSETAVEADGGAGNGDINASAPPEVRWRSSIDSTEIAEIAALPEGAVLVASVARSSGGTSAQLDVKMLEPDGTMRWSQAIAAGHPRTPETGPPLAVDAHGDIYLLLGRQDDSARIQIGDQGLQCATNSCLGLASFDAGGELRWLVAIDVALDWHWIAATDDGVVLALAFGDSGPILMAVGADGAERWTQPYPIDIPAPYLLGAVTLGAGRFLAGDRAGGVYVAGSERGCGVLARVSGADGSVTWKQQACGDGMLGMLSDVVVLEDGTAFARAHARDAAHGLIVSFAPSGELIASFDLPFAARPSAAGGDTALLAALATGPVAGIAADGSARFQWPGTLAEGALSAHPSGPCQADLAPAPDGELYVLSRGCAPARALLGAPKLGELWTDPLDEGPYDQWLLARVHVPDDYAPRCGNGLLDPGESCDGDDFDNPRVTRDGAPRLSYCSEWLEGTGNSGMATCTDHCNVDLSSCQTTCGNGMLDPDESCDGDLFRGSHTCDEANLGSGPLACDHCEYDLSVCPMRASCGNGVREDWEACDGLLVDPQQGPPSCQELGLSGTITCIECLVVDTSSCM
jgi:hypothetical protein